MSRQRLEQWATRDWTRRPAVVLSVSATALSYVRSLHRRGIPTLLLTEEGWQIAPSRYGLTLELPPVDAAPDAWLDVLDSVARRLSRRPVLLVAFDQALLLVGKHAEELGRRYDFLMPPLATSAAMVDKQQQYELARAAQIPIPRTAYPRSGDEAVALADDIGYPCLIKPHIGSAAERELGGKIAVAPDPSTLRRLFDRTAPVGIPCMVQEMVPGGDDALYGYTSFWGRDGMELAWITKQKIRQFPALYGVGSYQRTVDAPRVAELSRKFFKALDYVGVGSVEFKYDRRDDTYRLMEVNARAILGNQLAVAAGVDLPYINYAYLVDGVVAPWEQRWGVDWIHELNDLRTLWRDPRGPAAAGKEWIRSLRRADTFALGDRHDPAPLVGAFAKAGLGKIRRGLRTRSALPAPD